MSKTGFGWLESLCLCVGNRYFSKAHFLDNKTILSISCINVGSKQEFGNLFKHSILKK